MISHGSHGLKKKGPTSPSKYTNAKKKTKSKSKQKQKSKKFSAKDFLQALIDLQNTNCSTNKKKRNTTRDISSALTIATPNLEKTVSSSKIRSKSSFSQYRKKVTNCPKQPMNINLCAIITEQDNVQYTEKTARSNYQEEEKQQKINKILIDNKTRRLNQNLCAIKIQRAWRNYQTYKMVHNIYLKQKRMRQQKKMKSQDKNTQNQLHIKICKTDFEKILRIKKQHAIKKQQRKQQQFTQTCKIIKQRYKQQNNTKLYQQLGRKQPIQQFQTQSYQSASSAQQQIVLNRMKERQAKMLNQVIDLIQKQSKIQTKQQLINKLIQKCQDNKRILQKDIKNQNILQLSQKCSQQSVKLHLYQHNRQQKKQKNNENIINYKHQIHNQQLVSINQPSQSQKSFDLDYQDITYQIDQIRIFQQRLQSIKQQKITKLEQIDDSLLESRITNTQAMQKKQAIYKKYEKEKESIDRNKKQYLFSLSKLKKIALKCQKSVLKQSSSSSKIRKSFSVGNTVIKKVIQDIKIFQIQKQEEQTQFYQYIYKKNTHPINKIQNNKPLTTTPILNLSSPSKLTQSQEQLLDQKNNTEVLKQYSEQIQELIQKQLIQQFVSSVFLDQRLFEYFKPYIEEIYEFRKVPDSEITGFMNVLRPYLAPDQIMLKRVNQQINPTSLQILRIIRDIDYQIDEYQLIIPEQCFKKFRASIQNIYQQKNYIKKLNQTQLQGKVKNKQIAQKVVRLYNQKKQKVKKYRNFERDLRIMYMKSVFNCINQFLIQTMSNNAYMNSRSSIGPGQLSLAIKQYNQTYDVIGYHKLLNQVQLRLQNLIITKCSIPSFKNYNDIEIFQKQVMKQIQLDSAQNQFKWVNFMDQVLQIWQDLTVHIIQLLFTQAVSDISLIFQ